MFKLVVLSCVMAAASASGIASVGWASPLAASWGAPVAASWAAPIAGPLAAPWAAPVAVGAPALAAAPLIGSNYRGPLSLAPGQPANILAADGRPLDTLSVNLDRAAHSVAKAVEGAHIIGKRSAVLPVAPIAPIGPVTWSTNAGLAVPAPLAAAPLVAAPLAAAPLAAAPLAAAPLAAAPLAAAPVVSAWGAAPWGKASVWGARW